MGILDDLLRLGSDDKIIEDDPWPALQKQVAQAFEDAAHNPEQRDHANLLIGMYGALFSAQSIASNTQRQRLSKALLHVALYLHIIDFPAQITKEIIELGNALIELDHGTVRSIFSVERLTNPVDPGDIWVCRAMVAAAVENLVQNGYSRDAIRAKLNREFAFLGNVLARKGSNFATSAFNWRKDLASRKVKVGSAQRTFDDAMNIFSQYHAAGFAKEFFAYKLLADATMMAARTNDAAMRILMPEIVKRRRSERRS